MMVRRFTLALLALLLTACGGAAGQPASPAPAPQAASGSAAPAGEPVHVTLRQAYLVQGYSAPFILAKEKGFYKDAGFDVDIPEGKGSAATAETVANGSDQFGFADAGTVALLISKGLPVKMLSVYLQTNPASFYYQPSQTTLSSPQDLKGKTIITFPADANYLLLPAVLGKYGMTLKDVKVQFVSPADGGAFFARNQGDVLLGFDTFYPIYKKLVPTIRDVEYAKFGVNAYSIGLVTSVGMIQQHPDEAQRFVAATNKGWDYALAHPDEAVAATLKEFPQAGQAIIQDSWKISAGLIHTPNTDGKPTGWMSDKDWQETIDIMHQYGGLQDVKPLDTYYTNRFIAQR